MKSTLTIKDLSLEKQLAGKSMSAVRGGNQTNATSQSNEADLRAPVKVGNGIGICGPATFQVDSNPTQTLSNSSTSTNDSGFNILPYCLPK